MGNLSWLIGLVAVVIGLRIIGLLLTNWQSRRTGIAQVDKMDGKEFEEYVAYLLIRNDADQVKVTQYQGDQGIDILFQQHGEKWGVQCKRYKHYVSNRAVQEAIAGGAFNHLDHVMVITNSHFSKSAQQLAKEANVILYDRERLMKFIMTAKKNPAAKATN
ncbi:restriction endonuclease [Schleiferilactobacillus perolens]|jgi:restriction system protein|uniref:restriction endonuclease n=1 Tax=Schleiferilactobacillus perolens TaxID=100468 RepID=UPI002354315D|nr:restriction endonuclease [Schleiferilactobacillus perolens]MCI2171805.1 restriction endonuclease [Schleiferilactobacillus perolens]